MANSKSYNKSKSFTTTSRMPIDKASDTLENHVFYGLALDEDQKKFRDAVCNHEKLIVLCNVKAGTSKTTISVGVANLLVQYGFYN